MMTAEKQREQSDAIERLRPFLAAAAAGGNGSIHISSVGRRPTSTGVSEWIQVTAWEQGPDDRPRENGWLTFNVARALGLRYVPSREVISMGGYGYCRATEIARGLVRLAGEPLYFQTDGFFAGPQGWVGKNR